MEMDGMELSPILTSGDIEIIKVNQDDKRVRIEGVGLKFYNEEYGWLCGNEGNYFYDKEVADIYYTNENGIISLKGIGAKGEWNWFEVSAPYGYDITDVKGTFKIITNQETSVEITNKQKWVKLSGYVWEDNVNTKSGNGGVRNNLFRTNEDDNQDLLLDGITVKIIDKTTNTVAKDKNNNDLITQTRYIGNKYEGENKHNGHGSYFFQDVETDKLKDYYIEFEYDGLTYQNVLPYNNSKVQSVPNYSPNRASKAVENTRNEFNKNFSVVKGDSINTGHTETEDGKRVYNLEYGRDESEHTATLNSNGKYITSGNDFITQTSLGNYPIKSDTYTAGYGLGLRRWI